MAIPYILPAPPRRSAPPQRVALPPILPPPRRAAPPPRRAAPPAPTNLRTSANPRGVAIITPRVRPTVNDRAAQTLATGNNPRGVAIAQRSQGPTVNDHYQAVRDTFAHQSPATQVKILQGIKAGRADPVTTRAVTDAMKALPGDRRSQIAQQYLSKSGSGIGSILHAINPETIFKGVGSGGVGGPASGMPAGAAAIGGPEFKAAGKAGRIAELPVRVPLDIAKATVQSPAVIPKTIKGLGEAALGGTAALAELPVKEVADTLHGQPTKAFTDLYHGMVNDYNARYGPLVAGNDKAFIDRIKKQGAGKEALDALGAVGGIDATLGRAVVGGAKVADRLRAVDKAGSAGAGSARFTAGTTGPATDAFAPRTNFFTRPRPGLRVAGGEVRAQRLAPTAGRVLVQRAEDVLRRGRERVAPGEIKPAAGEVRPLFGNRSQRILTSHVASKYRNLQARMQNTEVRAGAHRALSRLSAAERRASPIALEGGIPLRSGERAALDAIDARLNSIRTHNAANPKATGNHIPPEHADQMDVATLQWMRGNIGKWLTPRLAKFVDQEGARNVRLEEKIPGSYARKPTLEARRLRVQGEAVGEEHPDEIAARGGDLTHLHETGGKPVLATPNAIKARAAQEAETAAREGAHHAVLNEPASARAFGADLGRTRNMGRAAEKARMLANYEQLRPGLLEEYSRRVRAAAREKGLPGEPSFFHHTDVPGEKLGDYTIGMGNRAMPASKRSAFELYKSGAVARDPRIYTSGLARAIKVGHQWRMVDEMMNRASYPEPSRAAIEDAGFGGRRADTLTAREYMRALQFDGHEAKNIRLYNPGRLRESTMVERGIVDLNRREKLAEKIGTGGGRAVEETQANRMLHKLMSDASIDPKDLPRDAADDEAFLKTTGWKGLPPAAHKEIQSSLQPSGLPGRMVGKIQGTAGHLILGGSPSFLVMNTLAHVLLASFGTRGRLLTDAAKMPLWWHGLSEEERAIVDAHSGGRVQARTERLGSTTPSKLASGWETLKQKGIGRFTVGHVTGLANPFHALFKAEDLQSNFFRRTVFYSHTKRMALNNMAENMSRGVSAMNRLEHVFKVGPEDQMAALLANMHTVEELGRSVVDDMGDYTRFTSGERRFLNNRAVLFYSFMRHATRLLLYTLPVKHPIATALVGEMANLHNDEVKKLLGGADLPYANSRVFFDKSGKLSSIDFNRSSPVGSFGVDLPTEGIGGLAQLIPPELAPVLNAIYKQTPTGGAYKPGVLSLLNSYLRLSYPERLIQDRHDGTQLQQSDSIPFVHDDPQTKKTAAAQAYQAAKEQASGPIHDKILAGLLGVYPKPDDIKVIAQRQLQAQGGSGGGWDFSGGSGSSASASSSGGWNFGGGGGSSASQSGGWNFSK